MDRLTYIHAYVGFRLPKPIPPGAPDFIHLALALVIRGLKTKFLASFSGYGCKNSPCPFGLAMFLMPKKVSDRRGYSVRNQHLKCSG